MSFYTYSNCGPLTIEDNRVHDLPKSTTGNPVQTLWELLENVWTIDILSWVGLGWVGSNKVLFMYTALRQSDSLACLW